MLICEVLFRGRNSVAACPPVISQEDRIPHTSSSHSEQKNAGGWRAARKASLSLIPPRLWYPAVLLLVEVEY